MVAVHKINEVLTLNKTAYVDICILDLSKTLMYDFLYNNIKDICGKKARPLFTDADNLMCEIKANVMCEDFLQKQRYVWF